MSYPEPTVSAVILNPERKLLLCRSHKWEDKYVIPGGHIEWGEKMEEALKREILEETGLQIHDIRLIGLQESIFSEKYHSRKHFIFIDYLCRSDSAEVRLNDEAESYLWIDPQECKDLDLGGFTASLLERVFGLNSGEDMHQVSIFYNYK